MIKGKKIFITGGRGFISSHLCEKLILDNKLILFDNFHRDGFQYSQLTSHKDITTIAKDVLDKKALTESMKGCDIVIHCAAIAGIDTVIKKPITTMQVNLIGTLNVLNAMIENNIKRLINFSTSEVYGPYVYKGTEDDLTTQGPIGQMRWTYAVSKLAAEHLAHCFGEEHSIKVTSIRPFNIYGPRQVGEGAIQKFISSAVLNKDIFITGDGTQIRAWCYIDDFVNGVLVSLSNDRSVGEVFNIGNPQGTITILKLAKKIISLAKSKSKIIFNESAGPDVEIRVPSIKKAIDYLGYEAKVSLDEGILETIKWQRKAKNY